jgi:hypothetical protein
VVPVPDKLKREAEADRQAEEIKGRMRAFPRSREKRGAWREDLLNTAREMAQGSLGLPDDGLRLFFNRAGLEATRRFVRDAKAFDSGVDDQSLFQALRNLWVVHCVQLLLGRAVSLSPAIFGYSMLYPWTDNHLDDPRVAGKSKLEFGAWLGLRLRGSRNPPADEHAAEVGRLVALIEGCFSRAGFEDVYFSLRAIHDAQMASLKQQRANRPLNEQDLLRTTVRKGGTSVLADAHLVAGHLNDAEAEFVFGFGVLLQLMDDLQDLQHDLANGHATLFARQAGGRLDEVTSKLWSFAQGVLRSCALQKVQPVRALIEENCKMTLWQAVARNGRFYSAGFTAELEACSPFRFRFVRERETTLAGEGRKIIALLRRRRNIDSAFDLLG